MAKKRSAKKVVKERCCDMKDHNCWQVFSVKIASMAFILFLVTVWAGLGKALLSVHWGIYLAIVIVFMVLHMITGCGCKKK